MLQLSVVHYQVLLCLDTYDKNVIAIIKLCKLNFSIFLPCISYKSAAGLSGLFLSINMVC